MLLFNRVLCKVQTANYEWPTLGFQKRLTTHLE